MVQHLVYDFVVGLLVRLECFQSQAVRDTDQGSRFKLPIQIVIQPIDFQGFGKSERVRVDLPGPSPMALCLKLPFVPVKLVRNFGSGSREVDSIVPFDAPILLPFINLHCHV